jgi:hypothetical protein
MKYKNKGCKDGMSESLVGDALASLAGWVGRGAHVAFLSVQSLIAQVSQSRFSYA